MSNPFRNRIFLLAICSAVLVLLFLLTSPSSAATARTNTEALKCAETAGTQLLWESLSHQFISSVQY